MESDFLEHLRILGFPERKKRNFNKILGLTEFRKEDSLNILWLPELKKVI